MVRSVCDVPYGESYWHKVDFHLPDDESLTGLPVMCNIHGGGWRNGCKEWQAMLAPAVTLTPAIFASVDYRLAPEVKIEAIVDDCCDALALVYNTVEQYGGDPDRIFLSGHSAGGHLSSYLALRPDLLVERGLPANVIKACMPSSGIYVFDFDQLVGAADFTTSAFNTSWMDIAYRQLFEDIEDRSVAAAYSSLNHVKGNTIPFSRQLGRDRYPRGDQDDGDDRPGAEERELRARDLHVGLSRSLRLRHHPGPRIGRLDRQDARVDGRAAHGLGRAAPFPAHPSRVS